MRNFLNWLFHRHEIRARLITVTRRAHDYRRSWLNANDYL
jgi:hypothetical protein